MGRPGNKTRNPGEIEATAKRLQALADQVNALDSFELAGFVSMLKNGRQLMAVIAIRCEHDTSTEHAAALCRSLADSLEQAKRIEDLHRGAPS
jgi:hypothetical protein